jgi:hypothetical protein
MQPSTSIAQLTTAMIAFHSRMQLKGRIVLVWVDPRLTTLRLVNNRVPQDIWHPSLWEGMLDCKRTDDGVTISNADKCELQVGALYPKLQRDR